jgi:hypothetical protein
MEESMKFSLALISGTVTALLVSPALAQTQSMQIRGATITIEPFTAYYGQNNLTVNGTGVESPMPMPHHIDCNAASNLPVAVQNICGPGETAYYTSFGQSGGNKCGYNVLSGVCIKENP